GHDTLSVYRPRTAVLVTGDEVTPSGVPAPGTVRDAIGPMLPGIAAWAGARADPPVQVRDRVDRTAGALRAAAGSGADVIAVCGASSKGPADHLRAALEALGAEVVVDGVACRPGHPQLLAHLGPPSAPGPAVVGLPGNPNAALAAALTLLVPLLAAIGGGPHPAAAGPAHPLRAALEAPGAEVVVDGGPCRPGHPQLLAHLGPPSAPGPAVVGLPGNPNAALAAALTLLVPLLAAIGGRPDPAAAAPAR